MSEVKARPKVYVETTVVSDATALPTNDLVLAGRQYVTREWWRTARERFDLYSSRTVDIEIRRGDAEAAQRRIAALKGAFPKLRRRKRRFDWLAN